MKNRDGMPLLIQLIHGMLDRDNMPFSLAGPHSTPQLRCRRPCPPESTLHLKGLDAGFRMQQLNAATKRIDYRIGAFDAARATEEGTMNCPKGTLREAVQQRRKEVRRLYSVRPESGFAEPAPPKRDAFAVSDIDSFKSP